MDLLKTKIYLDKLNREFARLSKDPDNIVRIDVDIVASYVRQLYDAVLSDADAGVATPTTPRHEAGPTRRPAAPRPPHMEEPAPIPAIPVPPPPPPTLMPEPPVREMAPRPAAQPPVVVEEKPAPAAPSEPEVVVHTKAPAAHHFPAEAEALFEEKQARAPVSE